MTSQEKWRKRRNKLLVAFLACTIICVMIVVWHFYSIRNIIEIKDGHKTVAQIDAENRRLAVFGLQGQHALSISLDSEKIASGGLHSLKACNNPAKGSACLSWAESSLSVTAARFGDSDDVHKLHCVKVEWDMASSSVPLDCVELTTRGDAKQVVWFGGHSYVLYPPQEEKGNASCDSQCVKYIPGGFSVATPFGESLLNRGGLVIEPLWFSSEGIVIKASTHHSVNVCLNVCSGQPKLCLTAFPDSAHQSLHHSDDGFHLDYMVCVADTLPSSFQETVEHFVRPDREHQDVLDSFQDMINDGAYFEGDLEKKITGDSTPDAPPNSTLTGACRSLIEQPLWNIAWQVPEFNATVLKRHLEPLHSLGLGGTGHVANVSQVYSTLGNFRLRNDSVTSMYDFISVLHDYMDWKVMLPLTAFLNYDSENFDLVAKKKFILTDSDKFVPSLTRLRSGQDTFFPGVLDLTNSNATTWFLDKATDMKQRLGIDHLYMYYGQSAWLPEHYRFTKPLHNPGHFSTLFADVAYKIGRCSVSEVAYDSQMRRQFVSLSPSVTMRGTLSSALAAGLQGYPFFVASFPCPLLDAAKLMEKGALREGLIRWIEMVAFFPVMHIPWDYDVFQEAKISTNSLAQIIKKYVDLRNKPVLKSALQNAIQQAEVNNTRPVIAPLWMAPGALPALQDKAESRGKLLLTQDQFMVGPDVVVAPIVDIGAVSRDLYLPPGKWKDILKNSTFDTSEGKWIKRYNVPVEDTAAFVRLS